MSVPILYNLSPHSDVYLVTRLCNVYIYKEKNIYLTIFLSYMHICRIFNKLFCKKKSDSAKKLVLPASGSTALKTGITFDSSEGVKAGQTCLNMLEGKLGDLVFISALLLTKL